MRDFSCPCIIGYGSSPPDADRPSHSTDGQSRDIPASDAIYLRVMWLPRPQDAARQGWSGHPVGYANDR